MGKSMVNKKRKEGNLAFYLLSCVLLLFLAISGFTGHTKIMAGAVSVLMVGAFFYYDTEELKRLPVIFFLAFVAFSGLTGFWAMSGKFFLREFSKMILASSIFLFILFKKGDAKEKIRKAASLITGTASLLAFCSVEAATSGWMDMLIHSIPEMGDLHTTFEEGIRLTGILGNANVLASILSLSVFFSLYLLCTAKGKTERVLYSVTLSISAFTLLLGFSMGGIACFMLSLVVLLAFAGEKRGAYLLRMLEGGLSAIVWGFAAFPFFNQPGAAKFLPLLFMLANCATVIFLEEKAAPKILEKIQEKQKTVMIILLSSILLLLVYIVAAFHMTGAYTFKAEDSLRRSTYTEPGEYSLDIKADGDVEVYIISQNMSQVMMHINTPLYQGKADGATFTVPEDTKVCYFTFVAPEGVKIEEARLNNGEEIPLKYTLFPGFIANRIQGLQANQNAIQRMIFFKDGLALFKEHPVLGCGIGAFETGAFSVQEFYYESRYIHNQYIQVLMDSGIIGFLFYVGLLVSLVFVLLRGKKKEEHSWIYPALWASLSMIVFHPFVEVSMSDFTFQCCAFSVFSMISLAYAPVLKSAEDGEKKKVSALLTKSLLCLVPLAFFISLILNSVAYRISRKPVDSVEVFLDHMVTAAKLDPYEANDAKFTYLYNVVDHLTPETRAQADQFAEELMEVQSNSISTGLVTYYLNMGEYEKAIDAAMRGAECSASDHDMWNDILHQLYQAFIIDPNSPLMSDDGPKLREKLKEYYQMLLDHNASSMQDIALDEASADFFKQLFG